MGSTRRRSPDSIRASGFACPAQPTCPPPHLASAVVFSSRHTHPHSFAPHPTIGGGLAHTIPYRAPWAAVDLASVFQEPFLVQSSPNRPEHGTPGNSFLPMEMIDEELL